MNLFKPKDDTFAGTFQTSYSGLLNELDTRVDQLKKNIIELIPLIYELYSRQTEWREVQSSTDFLTRLSERTNFSTSYLRDLIKIGGMFQQFQQYTAVMEYTTIPVLRAIAYKDESSQMEILRQIHDDMKTMTPEEIRHYNIHEINPVRTSKSLSLNSKTLEKQHFGETFIGKRQVFWFSHDQDQKPDKEQIEWLKSMITVWESQ
ncbi:MAG: hypothetical protein HQM12_20590 [SAR324 cluster bacterium]|nr:hypothetical protein [SAR324 cluster bacterium]